MHKALFYEKLDDSKLKCNLCSIKCVLKQGEYGVCGVRFVDNGELYSSVYARAGAVAVDPIEKKPLYHVFPSGRAYSFATIGCNFKCPWCQNSDLAHYPYLFEKQPLAYGQDLTPEEIIAQAIITKSSIIAATYSEPTVFFEYAFDVARLAKEHGLINVWVTNGSITYEALKVISPYLDAANVDIKAFSDKNHASIIGFRPSWVLDTITKMKELGIWVEATTLIVPGFNDDENELKNIAEFLYSLDPNIPWHISRYFPHYNYAKPPTNIDILLKTKEIAKNIGLKFIYLGNIHWGDEEVTYCPSCGTPLIIRKGYEVVDNHINTDGTCFKCGKRVPGIKMGGL